VPTKTTKTTVLNMSCTETTETRGTALDIVRKRVSVPASDQVVLDWFAAQVSPSASVRLLIHEEVAQHGTVDRMNRIGVQPPATTTSPTDGAEELARLRTELADLKTAAGPFLEFLQGQDT
jgi:hypothetical protein